jgi:hypothetical protein
VTMSSAEVVIRRDLNGEGSLLTGS